jgi:hypothetical protein
LGNLGCRGLPPRVALLLRDIQLRLSQWGYWCSGVPLITIWDPVAGPGRTPDPSVWKQLGPKLIWARALCPNGLAAWAARDSGGGTTGGVGRVGRPFGARRVSPARGLAG